MKVYTIYPMKFSAFILLILFTGCMGDAGRTDEVNKSDSDQVSAKSTSAAKAVSDIPTYTVVQSNVDGKDNVYRVQVGDTLPNEEQSIALARKVADIGNMPSVNTAVFITRAGYSAIADAHASVTFLKNADKPAYALLSNDNARLKRIEALTFDSIPNKKMVVECLDAAGAKRIIFEHPAGGYFEVVLFESGGYDLEPVKAESKGEAFTHVEDGETFTYRFNETGEVMEVYNGSHALFNSFKVLRRGNK